MSVAAIRWLALWSRPAGTTGLPFGEDPEVLDRWSLREMCSVGLSFTPFVAGSLCFYNKESTGRGSVRLLSFLKGAIAILVTVFLSCKRKEDKTIHIQQSSAGVSRKPACSLFLAFFLSKRGGGERIATWLILPVVICLSQRLSHACLSMSIYTVKLRMAH